ncbi:cupin domain-containing protein [Brevibacterium oceani]|uniref:cupin domain-containing protein n=1 Tax=Brevibacterium oceani TaxID=358099 RepID=UPI0015E771F6|nr:cupin domain-containing protein [Brevibacterium oceani]
MSAIEPINTHEFPLHHEPIEAWQRVGSAAANDLAGADVTTAFAELGSIGGADYGLWEMSVGSMRDVEGDEVFLVVSGTGRIEFEESTRPDIDMAPGALVRLSDGEKTRWTITEAPLRKLFIAPSEG